MNKSEEFWIEAPSIWKGLLWSMLAIFHIKKMRIGDSGTLNWSFLQKGLVDEVSLILSPMANGDPNAHRFFTAKEPFSSIKETVFRITPPFQPT